MPTILKGMKCLEYRGYDSAGLAVLNAGVLQRRRAVGKVDKLVALLKTRPLKGQIGLGHTRWATHGKPFVRNAHPHFGGRNLKTPSCAVVHNGIVDNYQDLKQHLQNHHYSFHTQADTEIIAHLLDLSLQEGMTPQEAISNLRKTIKGDFAIAVLFANMPDTIFGLQKGCPLVVACHDKKSLLASDPYTAATLHESVRVLKPSDMAILSPNHVDIMGEKGPRTIPPLTVITMKSSQKKGFKHYMLKEIFQQPTIIKRTLHTLHPPPFLPLLNTLLKPPAPPSSIPATLTMVGCGSSYHALLCAKYWFAHLAHREIAVEMASEFRFTPTPLLKNGWTVFVSQSGETADTLHSLRLCKAAGQTCIVITNVPQSQMANEAHGLILTEAGQEIAVASTKSFTAQLTALAVFTCWYAYSIGTISRTQLQTYLNSIKKSTAHIKAVISQQHRIKTLAETFLHKAQHTLFLGRGIFYPLALEGALKLKELSYIHAEGLPAGEMKHGPIALLQKNYPVIVLEGTGSSEKIRANLKEAQARGGKILLVSDQPETFQHDLSNLSLFPLPKGNLLTQPLIMAPFLQLLAYHTALHKGLNVDKPRNLAKSVTVD